MLFVFVCPCLCYHPEISFQIHSYDDTEQWDSLLHHKNVSWMKVDIHFVPPSADCQKFARQYPGCSSNGVLLLAHNDPASNFNIPYDTSDDMVQKLSGGPFKQEVYLF